MRPFAEMDELVFFVLLSLPISRSFSEEFALGVKAAPSDLSDEDDDDNATISSAREVVMLYEIDIGSNDEASSCVLVFVFCWFGWPIGLGGVGVPTT